MKKTAHFVWLYYNQTLSLNFSYGQTEERCRLENERKSRFEIIKIISSKALRTLGIKYEYFACSMIILSSKAA